MKIVISVLGRDRVGIIAMVATVPACRLLTCQVVGGKWSLPASQVMAANSARAGASRCTGLRASCG